MLSKVQVRSADQVEEAKAQAEAQAAQQQAAEVSYEHKEVTSALSDDAPAEAGSGDAAVAAAAAARGAARQQAPQAPSQPIRRDMPKVGRNEPCPCGSGKKFKACHGKLN